MASPLPLYGEALQTSRTNYSKRTLLGECRAAEPSSSHRGADAKERRLRRREVYLSRGVLPQQSIRRGLLLLMECKAPDGRYLVTRKVHWQAVYRVLVDEGWYDASLGYAGFVDYIRSVAPPGGFRIMPDVETIRHISQTLYARPFRDWRYDAGLRHQALGIRADEDGGGGVSILLGGRKIGEKLVDCNKCITFAT